MDNYISAHNIYNGILLGAKKVSLYREELNIANKFPVPDSDTGDNLHYQMSRIRNNLEYDPNINNILSSTSEIAVLNSRGNSGAIFSQFFVGFEKNTPSESRINLNDFANCFKNGYKFSLNSISNPITEGTILIAIKTWSESLEKNLKKIASIEKLYRVCLEELKKVVNNSKYVLRAQKQSKYNDAGASAFLYFIEGFMSAIVYNKEDDFISEDIAEVKSFDAHSQDKFELSKYRFCTEILIKKNEKIFDRNLIAEIGDSLAVSESKKYLKVHIHTDKPFELTKIASEYGEIIESKCDDMKIQSLSSKSGGTALIIDSIADLPESFYSDNTYMIPINLLINNVSFKDKRTIYPEMLKKAHASSSQANSEELRFVISRLLDNYDDVIIITVSSKMSGLHSQYEKIIEDLASDRIRLVDSKLNSVAEGLIVSNAIKMIDEKMPVDKIISNLEKVIDKTTILVSLKNINRMVSSGRLNNKIGKVLKWINFLPIITINNLGEGKIFNFSFSEKKNKKTIINTLVNNANNIENYSVVHCNCLDDAKEFAKEIETLLGFPPLYISDISYVIQSFSGEGSIAVGYSLKN